MLIVNIRKNIYKEYRINGSSQMAQWQRIHLPVQMTQETQVESLDWKNLLEEEMATHSRLPGKYHGLRSLIGYSQWGHTKSNMTEHTHVHMRAHPE